MNRSSLAGCLVAANIAFSFSTPSQGQLPPSGQLPPGRVRDPEGKQLFQRIIYNPVLDDYLLLYVDGRALVGHLSPAGVFSGETEISANIGVTVVNAAFNPDDETFLLVYRDGSPAESYGRYLTSSGTPIGDAFFIGVGGEPSVAYSPADGGRYVATWTQLSSGTVRYRVIDGDATSGAPNITAGAQVAFGLSDALAYGSAAQKFLVVYAREVSGTKGNIYGRFISGNGLSVGSEFVISNALETQGSPRVAYAASTNRWMVIHDNWAGCGGGCPHIQGALVSDTGSVVKTFNVAATSAWDVPGPITYNTVTDTFITGWRSAFSDTNIQARSGEFSPVDGKLVRPTVLLSNLNIGVEGLAARPDPLSPQATFVMREGFGSDGVRASIVDLPVPVPDTFPPGDVTDLSGAAVPSGNPVPATAIASTTPGPSAKDMTKTTDGDAASYWQSPSRVVITPEFITWDLGATKVLSNVALLARSAGSLFPVDYQIQVSTDNVNFVTVFSVTGAAPAPGTWVDHALPDPAARYVRLQITKTKKAGSGKYLAQVAEVEILEATPGETLNVRWTAPGDDDDEGRADSYELRWSLNPINAANFGAATAILPLPSPSMAGTMESVMAAGFPSEDIVYFALKSSDEVPNTSGLSNVLQLTTPGVPPAPVLGLTASDPTGDSVDLVWQSSGDDGNTGNATTYDIRYSTSPFISDAIFDAAASVMRPATVPKPAFESFTLGELGNQTTYYFAIKALDEVGLASGMNVGPAVTATTLDVLPPSEISDLAVSLGGGTATLLNAPAVAASGENSTSTDKTKTTDGITTTYWSTLGRIAMQDEFITLDTGAVRNIGKVRLFSRTAGALFPQDLQIQLSNDGVNFSTVFTALGLPATQGIWHTFDFEPAAGRYVRVYITTTRLSGGGLYFAQIAEIEAYEIGGSNELTFTWTSPGDDGDIGSASSYDLRYSTSPIPDLSSFNAATPIGGEPTPGSAGSQATFRFDAPAEDVTLFFRMRTLDEVGNPSVLSNQDSETTNLIPPSSVSDLMAFNATSVTVDLSWTSPGDDGGIGTADQFDVRFSTSPITAGNFISATPASGEPVPAVAGTLQGMTVGPLSPSTTYYFAMRVHDETGTPSFISNVVSAATDAPDTTAPSGVVDLAGSAPFTVDLVAAPGIQASSVASASTGFAQATDGIATSFWGSLGTPTPTIQFITVDTGAVHDIGEVRLLSRLSGALFPEDLEIQVSSDNVLFTTVKTATGLPSTKGLLHTFNFPAVPARYVRIYVTKTRVSGGGLYFAQIAEIQVFEANFFPGPVTLQWTAPGDDGANGTAKVYDLRYSSTPITDLTTFNAATQVAGEPNPQPAGSPETFDVSLPPGAYYFAIRTRDEVPNISVLSNVPVIVVP